MVSALTTPVAFIIFNRKVRLFAQRSRRRVFVIADAPRPGVENRCRDTRNYRRRRLAMPIVTRKIERLR
ncbi:MAG: hypothetical protein DME49_04315 [Verrucomicrobia bacterium]|nr:MAG: hypothetical protein DME49_04315 [Verrucomicrobiota bacterium]PYK94422.1 MAG: hypothetical protein DME36_05725 [Verrucomicrobiota bacterium]